MPAHSEPHPLRALLDQQGRSLSWLADSLGCSRQVIYGRLSGRRTGKGTRGPKAWTPAPVRVVQVSKALGVPSARLADWLGVQMEVGHG